MDSDQKIEALMQAVAQIETNQQQIVDHLNRWIAKVQGIDTVAFAALLLHGDKEFNLTLQNVTANHKKIGEVMDETRRYRDERQEQLDKEAAAIRAAKPAPAKLLVPRKPKGELFLPNGVKRKKPTKGTPHAGASNPAA